MGINGIAALPKGLWMCRGFEFSFERGLTSYNSGIVMKYDFHILYVVFMPFPKYLDVRESGRHFLITEYVPE